MLEAASVTSLFWFILSNPFILWWQAYYVLCTIDPIHHQSKVTNNAKLGLQAEFHFIVVLGFVLILLNGVVSVCITMLLLRSKYFPLVSRKIRLYLILPVMIPIGIFLTFGPFISPFVTPRISWRSKYRHACDGMDVRVYLDSAETRHSARVEFFNFTSGENYTMVMAPDPEIWGIDNSKTYNFSLLRSDGYDSKLSTFMPAWEYINYNLDKNEFNVFDSNNKSVKSGEFSLGKGFKIPVFGVTGNLEAFAQRCVFDPTAEIFDLKVEYSGKRVLKTMVMKTVQFDICGLLQVCAGDFFGDMTAVPVGLLLLQRAGRPSNCCTGGVKLGIAGRDKGKNGNG